MKTADKKTVAGAVLISAGMLFVAVALILAAHNLRDTARAGRAAASVMEKLRPAAEAASAEAGPAAIRGGEAYEYGGTVDIGGQKYIGYVSFPDLGLELPVNGGCDEEKLKDGPCRYFGVPSRPGFVICGHNYTVHFGRLGSLREGAGVIFTDAEGKRYVYEVVKTESVAPDAVRYMISDEWDLTLYTCTLSGTARYTVRCKLAENM